MNRRLRRSLVGLGFAALSAVRADVWFPRIAPWTGAILMLHRVRPASADPFQPNAHLEITPDHLDLTLSRLKAGGIDVVSLDDALSRMQSGDRRRFAVITLDDGYADNVEHALPVFRRHDAPFTVYVATGMIDGSAGAWWLTIEHLLRGSTRVRLPEPCGGGVADVSTSPLKVRMHERLIDGLCVADEAVRRDVMRDLAALNGLDVPAVLRREMMTWDQIRDLAAEPLATIGSHTVDHPALSRLNRDEARREMVGGADRLEAMLGVRPAHFAYPFGSSREVDCGVVRLAADLGFRSAVTTHPGLLRSPRNLPLFSLPRLSVNGLYQTRRHIDLLLSGAPFALTSMRRSSLPIRVAPQPAPSAR